MVDKILKHYKAGLITSHEASDAIIKGLQIKVIMQKDEKVLLEISNNLSSVWVLCDNKQTIARQ